MRNLKKILSLALALMMILSVTASAAFTDAAKIDADYAESVEVLNGMEVFQGYEDGSFGPTKAITRAEVAAIVYRIATADVEDDKVALYVDSTNFADVKAADWFSGYVGYCTNAGYIKGYEDGTFKPLKTVTGFETLAMIMRAMGYDAENEFSGAAWSQNIAKIATKAGILADVKPGQLAAPATREMVAELLFAAIQATTVKFVPAFGYVEGLESLGKENFGLTPVAETTDTWGRPSYGWKYNTGDEETYFNETPVATYYTAVTECDVAADFDYNEGKTFDLYVNAAKSVDVVHAWDTVDTIGAQGRQTFVYDLDGGRTDRIVMIDTFLAKVESVKEATYDARNHRITPSEIVLTVYDGSGATKNLKLTNKGTSYPYVAGDMVLVNATTNAVSDRDTSGYVNGSKGAILGLAKSEVGAQSVIWYNIGKHTINNTTYNDAAELHLNEAGNEITNHTWYFDQFGNVIGATDISTQYDYAVVKNIWWAGDATTGAGKALATLIYMDGTENVVEIDSIDGYTTKYSVVNTDIMYKTTEGTSKVIRVATNAAVNALTDYDKHDIIKGHLYQVETYSDGSVALEVVATEIKDAEIYNKYAFITGTGGSVVVDTTTKFLVRGLSESSSFKTYTGMNEMPSFVKKDSVVDVVKGSDGVADYVYIIGATESSTNSQFILITNNAYSAVLKTTANGINYHELTLPVPAADGSVATLKIKNGTLDANDNQDLLTKLTTVGAVGKLWYVTYVDGYATAATAVGTQWMTYTEADNTTAYAQKLEKSATYFNGVLNNGNSGWYVNVTSATTVVGTLEADMTDKDVYVLYSDLPYVASKIYVLDYSNERDDAPTAPDSVMLTYSVKMIDASGKELNTVVMGTQKHVGAVGAQSIAYKSVVEAMKNDAAEANWTNAEGAVALMTAMGIYNENLANVAPVVVADTAVGNAVSLTFVVKVQ